MSLLQLEFEFSSAPKIGEGRTISGSHSSIGAERIFSLISLGWLQLFGEESFKQELISRFMSCSPPFLLSDLFVSKEGRACVPSWSFCTSGNQLIDRFASALVPIELYFDQAEMDTVPLAFLLDEPFMPPQNGFSSTYLGFIQLFDLDLQKRLGLALDFMKEEGIGAGRSSGSGRIEKMVFSKQAEHKSGKMHPDSKSAKSEKFLLLSRCYPDSTMLANLESASGFQSFRLLEQSGWIYDQSGRHTGIQKEKRSYFESGSLFSFKSSGSLLDLSKDGFTCYRYALPFNVQVLN